MCVCVCVCLVCVCVLGVCVCVCVCVQAEGKTFGTTSLRKDKGKKEMKKVNIMRGCRERLHRRRREGEQQSSGKTPLSIKYMIFNNYDYLFLLA